eukprot:2429941-Prymnesium_polylepis.1
MAPTARMTGTSAHGTAPRTPMCHAPPGSGMRTRSSISCSTSFVWSLGTPQPRKRRSAAVSSSSQAQQHARTCERSPRRL